MKRLFILIFILTPLISYSQKCPYENDVYKFLISKPIGELSDSDIDLIFEIENKCAEFILPNFQKALDWTVFFAYGNFIDFGLIYFIDSNNIVKNDSTINFWIRKLMLVSRELSEFTEVSNYIFYMKEKRYELVSNITIDIDSKRAISTRINDNEKLNIVPNSIMDLIYKNLLKAE
jgi:hypothetical protein